MLAQAAGLALVAAVSPTALLIAAVYLGSARPRVTALCYLAGAVVMTTVIAVVVLVALRSGGLELSHNRTPRYGLRLGLGLIIVAAAALVARREPRPPDPAKPAQGFVSRLVADPVPVTALLAGVVVFGPSVPFIAAVQVIATARASVSASALGLAVIITINVAFVWLPLLSFLAWPKQTAERLAALNAWLRARGRLVVATALGLAGASLVINGVAGLITRQ
ncbi:MAG TPA: GAP family protein [Streptosporangiaceae bacterium]